MDGKLLYQTSTGPKFFTNRSFGYHQLLLTPILTEEELLSITATPPLPNGLFELYIGDTLFIANINGANSKYYYLNKASLISINSFIINSLKFLGIFASMQDIKNAYPEYFI